MGLLHPVGVPLLLLQTLSTHLQSLPPPDPLLIATDFSLAQAIYGGDRLTEEDPVWKKWYTEGSRVLSCSLLLLNPNTVSLAPACLLLYQYKEWKQTLGWSKPFAVSFFWCLAVVVLPSLSEGGGDAWAPPFSDGGLTPSQSSLAFLFFFLNMAGLSNAADMLDVEEDEKEGTTTLATTLTDKRSSLTTFLLVGTSVLVHSQSDVYNQWDCAYDTACMVASTQVMIGAGEKMLVWLSVLCCALLCKQTVDLSPSEHEMMGEMLKRTEPIHKWSIDASSYLLKQADSLPPFLRKKVISSLLLGMEKGDEMGGAILQRYMELVRKTL